MYTGIMYLNLRKPTKVEDATVRALHHHEDVYKKIRETVCQ